MKISFVLIPILVASALGCAGSRQRAAGPKGASDVAAKPSSGAELATGEVREALLVLRRVHFALDSDELLPEARTALAQAADRLRAHPSVQLSIDGHTDDRGTTEYNLALGDRRGTTVKAYLVRLGIPAERLHVVSFGKEQPLVSGRDVLAYAQNRRADFRLMRGDVQLVLEPGSPLAER